MSYSFSLVDIAPTASTDEIHRLLDDSTQDRQRPEFSRLASQLEERFAFERFVTKHARTDDYIELNGFCQIMFFKNLICLDIQNISEGDQAKLLFNQAWTVLEFLQESTGF